MNNNSGIHILYNKLILSILFKHYFNDLSIEIIKKVHLSVEIVHENSHLYQSTYSHLRWNKLFPENVRGRLKRH